MFNPKVYRDICSEMRVSEETIEEVIAMTQNSKRSVRRPLRLGLVAAAVATALVISVSAAGGGEFLEGIVATIRSSTTVGEYREDLVMEGGEQIVALRFPEVSVEERDGRTILVVDGVETDITDAMAQDGTYRWDYEDEGAKVRVEVFLDEEGNPQAATNVSPAEGTAGDTGMSLVTESTTAG